MMMNMKITEEQAGELAERILLAPFKIYGYGHFEIRIEELAQIIKIAFNSTTFKESNNKLCEYYKEIASEREL